MRIPFYSYFRMKSVNLKLSLNNNKCDLKSRFNFSDESTINIRDCVIKQSDLYVRKESKLSIGKNCIIENCKIIVDRMSSLRISENCKIRNTTLVVNNNSELDIGADSLVESDSPYLAAGILVSNGSATLGNNSNVKGSVSVNNGSFQMGSNSFFNHGSEIRCENRVVIGDYVFISYFVDIYDTNTHSTDWKIRKQEVIDGYPNRTIKSGAIVTNPVFIGDYVWIGKNSAILKGTNIGSRSIIGTRSVVTKSFPEDSIIIGNPAVLAKKSI